MALMFNGTAITPRSAEFTIPMRKETARKLMDAFPEASREIRIELARGQRWPDSVKRGSVINLDVQGSHFVGKVRFRRLHRVVIDTYPGNKVPIGDLLTAQRLVGQR